MKFKKTLDELLDEHIAIGEKIVQMGYSKAVESTDLVERWNDLGREIQRMLEE